MKKITSFFLSLIFTVAIFNISQVFAQEKSRLEGRTDRIVSTLKEQLSLTDQQEQKVKEIVIVNIESMRKEMDKYDKNPTAMRDARRKQMEEMDKKIESILTKDQKTKYEQYKKDRMQRFQQGRSRSNDSNPR